MQFANEFRNVLGDDNVNNFKQLFKNPQLKINDILSIKGVLSEIKNLGEEFGNLLIKRHDLIKGLIDTALRPQLVNVTNVEHSYLSCEIIAVQTEVFHEHIFGSTQISEEDNVKSEEQTFENNKQLFLYLFNVLDNTQELNRTVGGYLFRMFSQLHYQNAQSIFEEFVNNRQLFAKCLKHLSNPSIQQILNRIVSSYGEQIYKSPKKINMTKQIFLYPFQSEQSLHILQQMLQNIYTFIDELVQKSDQFSQYIIKQLISIETLSVISTFIQSHKQSQQIINLTASILSIFAQFYIKQQVKQKKKPKYFMAMQDQDEIKEPRIISQIVLSQLYKISNNLFNYSQGKTHTNICKLLADVSRINMNVQFFFLDQNKFNKYKILFKTYPHNNVLHNQIKKIIIASIKAKKIECLKSIIQFMNDNILQKSEIKNQFYHISLVINDQDVQQNYQSWQNVKQWRQGVKKMYSTVIPSQTSNTKKNRQLNDFFVDQQQLCSEDDISSQGMSPKQNFETVQDIPVIPLFSKDSQNSNQLPSQFKQNFQSFINMMNVKSVQSIDDNREHHETGAQLIQSQQIVNQPPSQAFHTLNIWKKVLVYELQALMQDLNH